MSKNPKRITVTLAPAENPTNGYAEAVRKQNIYFRSAALSILLIGYTFLVLLTASMIANQPIIGSDIETTPIVKPAAKDLSPKNAQTSTTNSPQEIGLSTLDNTDAAIASPPETNKKVPREKTVARGQTTSSNGEKNQGFSPVQPDPQDEQELNNNQEPPTPGNEDNLVDTVENILFDVADIL